MPSEKIYRIADDEAKLAFDEYASVDGALADYGKATDIFIAANNSETYTSMWFVIDGKIYASPNYN